MAPRFTYSRWDGTQRGFDLDADLLFDQLTDELLYHGDVNAALRRMMQDGMHDADGNRLDGLRDLMEKLRRERQERLDRSDLGGVYDEISRELDDIVDEERHAIDNALRDAENDLPHQAGKQDAGIDEDGRRGHPSSRKNSAFR